MTLDKIVFWGPNLNVPPIYLQGRNKKLEKKIDKEIKWVKGVSKGGGQ